MTDTSPPRPERAPSRPGHISSDLAPSPPPFRGEGAGHTSGHTDLAPLENWRQRLDAAVAETERKRAARRDERRRLDAARKAGKAAAHALRLARIARQRREGTGG